MISPVIVMLYTVTRTSYLIVADAEEATNNMCRETLCETVRHPIDLRGCELLGSQSSIRIAASLSRHLNDERVLASDRESRCSVWDHANSRVLRGLALCGFLQISACLSSGMSRLDRGRPKPKLPYVSGSHGYLADGSFLPR